MFKITNQNVNVIVFYKCSLDAIIISHKRLSYLKFKILIEILKENFSYYY